MLSAVSLVTYAYVLFAGTWLGPDYVMVIDPSGSADIGWYDGSVAYVQFGPPLVAPNGEHVLRGVITGSTDNNKATRGDIVLVAMDSNLFGVIRPNNSVRWSTPICWQGFNRPLGQYQYPCN